MKRIATILAIIYFLLAGLCCVLLKNVHRSRVFNRIVDIPIIGGIFYYCYEPPDYYHPLAEIPLFSGNRHIKFRCRYNGRHEIQIFPILNREPYEINVGMKIKIFDAKGTLMYENEKNKARIMGGEIENGKMVYNYCYAYFFAPCDVPVDAEIYAQIECYGDIDEVAKCSPDARIVVRKCFDK